jgi:hypothetical protein
MKVFVTGGTGFVGTSLVLGMVAEGHQITVLTRSRKGEAKAPSVVDYVHGDPTIPGAWQERAGEHDVLINLAGNSIFRRWTPANKKAIRDSRIETTRNLVQAMARGKAEEKVFLSASGTGYYGFRGEEGIGEDAPPGRDFLAVLSQEWESEARKAAEHGARVVLCRLGVVLGRNGGALKAMLPAFRMGLGSPLGKADQWFSWVHETDLVRIFLFLMGRKDASGPVNCTAPQPVRNRDLTKSLGLALRRPTFLPPLPGPMLRIALGEFANVFLEGQCAVPKRLLSLGFSFRFPGLDGALEDLLQG